MTPKNIFVLGLTDIQREELETVRHAEDYAFHGVLDYQTLVNTTEFDFEQLLQDAARSWTPSRAASTPSSRTGTSPSACWR